MHGMNLTDTKSLNLCAGGSRTRVWGAIWTEILVSRIWRAEKCNKTWLLRPDNMRMPLCIFLQFIAYNWFMSVPFTWNHTPKEYDPMNPPMNLYSPNGDINGEFSCATVIINSLTGLSRRQNVPYIALLRGNTELLWNAISRKLLIITCFKQ